MSFHTRHAFPALQVLEDEDQKEFIFSSSYSCSVMSTSLQHHGLYSLPGSSVHIIVQATVLEEVAISYFRGSSQSRDRTLACFISCTGRWVLYHQHYHPPLMLHSTLCNLEWITVDLLKSICYRECSLYKIITSIKYRLLNTVITQWLSKQ